MDQFKENAIVLNKLINSFINTEITRTKAASDEETKTLIKAAKDYYKARFKIAKAAFEKECQNYHDFGGSKKLDNKIHPDRPKDKDYECPVCDIFDEK